jgi:UDP-3-O-[3-hydroxymyristoyl] glucosamine N-acyltransferase
MSTIENQCIIGKQKMRKSSITNFETFQQTPLTAAKIIRRLKASITKTNNRSDKGSACLSPRELLKKPLGEPLTNTENHIE